MFLLPLGRTNTEYHTLNPQYGSNINAQANRKVQYVLYVFCFFSLQTSC